MFRVFVAILTQASASPRSSTPRHSNIIHHQRHPSVVFVRTFCAHFHSRANPVFLHVCVFRVFLRSYFFLLLDASFSLADFFPFCLFVFRVFVAISTKASASKSSALIDTATLEHHPPPTVASPQQYQRYNLRHFDSPISSFVCIYPMRATHFVFV